MTNAAVNRRLAAIVVADVVGYSRLMAEDELGTLASLRIRRTTILDPVIRAKRGRVVKLMGDGVLIEFPSAVNAVEATLELQRQMATANEHLPEHKRIILRVGINLGDVIGQGSDIYGDGVNVAARLEPLAEPGGICISSKVHEEIRGKIDIEIEDLGEVELKNIGRPVQVYRLKTAQSGFTDGKAPGENQKPSIAVLAFNNMSGDPGQDYFADGISENIITDLAKFRDLAVIARNSSFAYKGKAPNISQISRELGAQYVLEGSIQRVGQRVRVTAQLIDGKTGRHLWAQRYDRDIGDTFAVQDELTETIVSTLASSYGGRLRKAWEGRRTEKTSRSFQAFDSFLCGLSAFEAFTKESVSEARAHFLEAVRIEPSNAKALAKLAWTYIIDMGFGFQEPDEATWARALSLAQASVSYDDEEAWGYWALGGYYMYMRQHDLALAEIGRAVALNGTDADVLTDQAMFLSYSGRAEEAIEIATKAMRLNAHFPEWYAMQLGVIYYDACRYEAAVATLTGLHTLDAMPVPIYLAASHAALGNHDEAARNVARLREKDPQITLDRCTGPAMAPYKRREDVERLRRFLADAGLT